MEVWNTHPAGTTMLTLSALRAWRFRAEGPAIHWVFLSQVLDPTDTDIPEHISRIKAGSRG